MHSCTGSVEKENDAALETTISPSSSPASEYTYMMIDNDDWNFGLQDVGTSDKLKTPKKTYKGKQIPAYGPNKIFYYYLSSIAIDYMTSFKENATEWCRVPKNTTNVKNKIIEVILQLRKPNDDGKLAIDQHRFLHIVYQQWGGAKAQANMTDSDKLRVFALIMTLSENFYILRQLSEGLFI